MKGSTVLINCSPKTKLSASGFLMRCVEGMIQGEKKAFSLRTASDHPGILEAIQTAGKVIFVTPLYVDSLPSHVLPFLKKMEEVCREDHLQLKVYVIANNGFIEGRQNEPLMQVMENFCARSGLEWGGGIGIGGGVMLNVERIMLTVLLGWTVLATILCAVQGESIWEPVHSFLVSAGELLILASAILVLMIRLARHVNRGTDAGKHYTRILVPSFLFILFADIFFTIVSVMQGGFFRGWLSRKKPDADYGLAARGER